MTFKKKIKDIVQIIMKKIKHNQCIVKKVDEIDDYFQK